MFDKTQKVRSMKKNSADLGDMINTFEGIVDIPLSKLFSKSNFGLLSKG